MRSTGELCWGIGDGGMEPGRRGLGKAKGETQTWFSYISVFPEAQPPSECAGVRLITKSFADFIFQSFEARCPGKDVSSVPWSLTDNVTHGLLPHPSTSPATYWALGASSLLGIWPQFLLLDDYCSNFQGGHLAGSQELRVVVLKP